MTSSDGKPGQDATLAGRIVTGVVAGMVTVTAAATAVGFWLSYGGLHEFAIRSGLAGAEAWAWPASVDLFIAAGEAGVTISALRRQRDRGAWAYLALGLVASVTGNVLHVHPGRLAWTPYAVAAVPPLAAMLALAALLRHVYRLAIDRHEAATAAVTRPASRAAGDRPARRPRPAAKAKRGRRSPADIEADALAVMSGQPGISGAALGRAIGVSDRTGRRLREQLAAAANGHQPGGEVTAPADSAAS